MVHALKRSWLILIMILLAGCASPGQQALAPGKPAPDFTLDSANGPPVTLSSLQGKPVLLYFHMAVG